LVAHSHVDHVLDAPAVATMTGAELIGAVTTMRFAIAAGLPRDRIVPVQGGEDYAFAGLSVRVIPALHSALDDKHTLAGRPPPSRPCPWRWTPSRKAGPSSP